MKRLISLVLCVILIFPSIYVCAEEEYTFYKVNVDAGEGVKSLKAVVNDGEIYIRTKDFSKITRYCFDDETSSFLVDGQEFEKAFKWVQINTKNKKIRVKTHELDLDNYYEINDELYLPFSQMLPILNASIYEIKDDVIYIANNKISLAEVLYDFDIQEYWFNMSDEFANKDFLAVAFVVPSYIFDTVVDFRFDRLDIFTHSGDFNDYKDIFSEFLADDNLYLEAMAKEPTVLDETADFFSSVNSTSKKLKSIYGWVEQAGKSEIDSKTGGKLLDALKESYDSKELEYDNLKGLNDAWTSGTISFADVFESLNYAYTYMTQVQDNRQMLNSVYKVNKKIYDKETDRRAAKQVHDLYGKKVVTAITKEIVGKLTEDAIKDLISPIAIYEATAKVAGIAINAAIPYDAGDIAKMPLYANVISSASSKYFSYSTETDEETTNLRLSLLLSMISSKKCFEIMKDSSEGAGKNSLYYQSKIEKIDKLIMALYMAEENTEFDSYEHFEDYKNENRTLINQANVSQHLQKYAFNDSDILKNFYFDNFSTADVGFLADVTNDEALELIVVENGHPNTTYAEGSPDNAIVGYVFTLNDTDVVCIETKVGGPSHSYGFFSWYIMENNNQYYLVEESHGMWQGHGELKTIIYDFDSSGNKNVKNVVSVIGNDTPESQVKVNEYRNSISSIIENSYEVYLNHTESKTRPKRLNAETFIVLNYILSNEHYIALASDYMQSVLKARNDGTRIQGGRIMYENETCYIVYFDIIDDITGWLVGVNVNKKTAETNICYEGNGIDANFEKFLKDNSYYRYSSSN